MARDFDYGLSTEYLDTKTVVREPKVDPNKYFNKSYRTWEDFNKLGEEVLQDILNGMIELEGGSVQFSEIFVLDLIRYTKSTLRDILVNSFPIGGKVAPNDYLISVRMGCNNTLETSIGLNHSGLEGSPLLKPDDILDGDRIIPDKSVGDLTEGKKYKVIESKNGNKYFKTDREGVIIYLKDLENYLNSYKVERGLRVIGRVIGKVDYEKPEESGNDVDFKFPEVTIDKSAKTIKIKDLNGIDEEWSKFVKESIGYFDKETFIQLKTKEENNMAIRKTVNIALIDDDKGIPVEKSLVWEIKDYMTEDTDEVTIQEIIMTKDIAKALSNHNILRTETTDLDIRNRTGQEVKLQPVKLKDLRWVIK